MTSSIEILTKSLLSRATTYSMPFGIVFFSVSIVSRTPLETSRPFAPACW